MAGYWPKFFCYVFMDKNKERFQYPAAIVTEQAWPVKVLLYGFTVNYGTRVIGNPERAR